MADRSGRGLVRFLSVSGKQFKWNYSLDGLLSFLQDEFSFSKWSLTKEDDKMAVIKASNVTVNWYKSTKTIQIQGVNEQLVKKHFDHLILSANLDDRQDSIDVGTETVNVYNHHASDLQGDEDSGVTVTGESVKLTNPSTSDFQTGPLISDSLVVNDEINAHLIPDSQPDHIDAPKLVVRLPLANKCGKETASHSEEVYDKPGQCHGCASLDAKLHQLRDYFKSEIDGLKKRLPSGAAISNFSSSQSSLSADNKLLKENQDLRRRLGEIESRYENLKADAKILRDENKSLVTALRLLSNELTDNNIFSNLHPTPGEGVDANNSQDDCDTSETIPFIKVSHNRQRKQRAVKKQPMNPNTGNRESSVSGNNNLEPNRSKKSTIIAGDSILKHLQGRNLSDPQSKVQVSSFPGCSTADMIDHIRPLVRRKPDTIIIHVGTNSLRITSSSRQCADEIVDLARMVEQEGISTAISSITTRADDPELSKRATEVNKMLRKFCRQNDWGFIEHNNIVADKHLNRSRLHLNRAGTNLLSQNLLSYINSH